MPRGTRGGGRPSGRGVRGYTLRAPNGRINYVGNTNNPSRRAGEHKAEGKSGRMQPETKPMSRGAAERWEANRLQTYRDNHGGRNPKHNKTKDG